MTITCALVGGGGEVASRFVRCRLVADRTGMRGYVVSLLISDIVVGDTDAHRLELLLKLVIEFVSLRCVEDCP